MESKLQVLQGTEHLAKLFNELNSV